MTEPQMNRRAVIVGGASAATAALLASSPAEAHTRGETDAWAVPAQLTDHVSQSAVDVRPLSTQNEVRVNLAPSSKGQPSDFKDGATVAVVLPRGAGDVEQSDVGSQGPVEGRGLIELIVGSPSDAPALQG